MKNRILTTPQFEKQYKRLKKKFRTLSREMDELTELLMINSRQGIDLGDNLYKIRLGSKSKGGGKSGGFRIITFVVEVTVEQDKVYLVAIYDKSEKDNEPKKKILELLANFFNNKDD